MTSRKNRDTSSAIVRAVFALAKEALLDGFAVFYQTIPSQRGADLPLLGITLFLAVGVVVAALA